MIQEDIFSPFFAMLFLTLLVWVYLYIRRINFFNSKKINPQELIGSNALADISPPSVSSPSDNFKNLFEIPVIFYALVLYLFTTQQVDTIYLTAAWIFVILRGLHSIVHCTFNLILPRFYLYLLATLTIWFMAFRAAFIHFAA